jgi:hypothetical protein
MTSSLKNGTTAALDVQTKDGVKFGKELREKEFLFADGYLNLNHGMSRGLVHHVRLEGIARYTPSLFSIYTCSLLSWTHPPITTYAV